MNPDGFKYVIISPVRDEEEYVDATIRSVIDQAIRPVEWIIVDDGSTDGTGAILDQYAKEYSWISVIHRRDRGYRKAGGGVVEAFYDGYNRLRCRDWDYIVKLDGDLVFDKTYFQRCLCRFHQETRLGVGGGTIFHIVDGKEVVERCPRFHVRGATKIYRRACWDAIGGYWQAPGWDTIDELKAEMLGWTTESFEDVRLLHQRMTGTAESLWRDTVKSGLARYVAGYHPLFLIASCARRLARKPYVISSVALFWGFVLGYVKRVPQVDDAALIRFVRKQQLRRLVGKQRVMN